MLCPNAKLTRARRYGRLSPRRCPSAASKCSRAVSGSPWAATSRPLAHAIRAKSDGIARSRRTCSKAFYAGGITNRDIAHHLESTVGTELSRETISKITDDVLEEVLAWQSRPLDPIYPILHLDAIVVKIRDGHQVKNKAAHIAVGVDLEGVKHVLGIWIQATEGAKFWAGVCAELANRGIKDVLIACCDG